MWFWKGLVCSFFLYQRISFFCTSGFYTGSLSLSIALFQASIMFHVAIFLCRYIENVLEELDRSYQCSQKRALLRESGAIQYKKQLTFSTVLCCNPGSSLSIWHLRLACNHCLTFFYAALTNTTLIRIRRRCTTTSTNLPSKLCLGLVYLSEGIFSLFFTDFVTSTSSQNSSFVVGALDVIIRVEGSQEVIF